MTSRSTEASVPIGAGLLVAGAGAWAAQYLLGIFVGWAVAVPVGGVLVALGALLFFPDMRLYWDGPSPLERLVVTPGSESERADTVEP